MQTFSPEPCLPSEASGGATGRLALTGLFLLLATAAVYSPCLRHGFLIWDDSDNIYANARFARLTPGNILFFWRHAYDGMYIPVTRTLCALLAAGARLHHGVRVGTDTCFLDASRFHAASIGLHCLNVLLVFLIVRIFAADWAAVAGALFFAWHPLQTESVAWAAEIKGLLGAFWSLLALWQYLIWARPSPAPDSKTANESALFGRAGRLRRRLRYALATLCFALALLSKPIACTLPLGAWCLDRWWLGRPWRAALPALVPWFVLAALDVGLTRHIQPVQPISVIAPALRPLVAGDALTFYLAKVCLPLDLCPDYGRTPDWLLSQMWVVVTWLPPCALALAIWSGRDRWPWLVGATGFSAVCLLPVLGLVPFDYQYYSTVADRYAYLALLGPASILARLVSNGRRPVSATIAALYLGLLAIGAARQAAPWKDNWSFCLFTLTHNPRSWMAYNNIGLELEGQGRLRLAEEAFESSIRANPSNLPSRVNLAGIDLHLGRLDRAAELYRFALHRGAASDARIWMSLGLILEHQGHYGQAEADFRRAVSVDPAAASAHNSLAAELYRFALHRDAASDAQIWVSLGLILEQQGRYGQAEADFRLAVAIDPAAASAHSSLGVCLMRQGRASQASAQFLAALKLDPQSPQDRMNLALLEWRQGSNAAAIAQWRETLRRHPDSAEARQALAAVAGDSFKQIPELKKNYSETP